MRTLDFFSAVTTPVTVMAGDNLELETATAFFYKRDRDHIYVVTNWHVVTGRKPQRPSESKRGSVVPTKLKIALHKQFPDRSISLSEKIFRDIPINNEHGDMPRWLEHPTYRHLVDVVAIQLQNSNDLMGDLHVNFIDEYDFEESLFPRPMFNIFVIGYPWGLTGGDPVLPLYKRGSVALEFVVADAGMLRFLIDCRTSEGMSGSPVICQHTGVWNPNDPMGFTRDGPLPKNAKIGTINCFAGVYSGRLESSAQVPKSEPLAADAGSIAFGM